jgi:predicted RNA-binding Zn-ribbon protein involved in translation (DUF1610 family)
MNDPTNSTSAQADTPHTPSAAAPVTTNDIVFTCTECHKELAVDKRAAGHIIQCPMCGKPTEIPHSNRVVTLAEAPETKKLQEKPTWEQELTSIQSALGETNHQRQEASNFFKHHLSEASRLKLTIEKGEAQPSSDKKQLEDAKASHKKHMSEASRLKQRVDKLDAKLKELTNRKGILQKEHPQ